MTRIEIDAIASGGDGIGRLDGKAVFVTGAIPGDVVDVEIVTDKPRFARAQIREMVQPSQVRVPMPCPHAAECGGCTWQMVPRTVQAAWKHQAVSDALERIGRVDSVPLRSILTPGPDFGYRNRIDLHRDERGPGFHRAGSHDVVPIDLCLLASPAVGALIDEVRRRPVAGELTLRAGVRTGEAVIIGTGHARPSEAVITEVVGGVRFQVSGRAFFQPNTDGADTLVDLAREAAGVGDRLIDAYAGVGLFAGTIGDRFGHVVAIELSKRAVGDLRRNVPYAEVIARSTVAGLRSLDGPVDVLVVDPPRDGLGADTVAEIVRLRPPVVVSVSCDAGTFARDARQLIDGGYRLDWIQPIDQFPHTPHIETVSRFVR
ncbi:MAG: class I SAM-dependent RNA methyltransferase [Acidimicrobiia bacterium]